VKVKVDVSRSLQGPVGGSCQTSRNVGDVTAGSDDTGLEHINTSYTFS